MNNTKALDLHGLTHNQYVYLEALLVNITTARWTGDTSFRFMPNIGSPAPYIMGFITKPLNEVNLLATLKQNPSPLGHQHQLEWHLPTATRS